MTSTITTTTIITRSTQKAADFGGEGEVAEGEELAEEGGLECDGKGVWDAEGEVELDGVAKYPFTTVALMGSDTPSAPCG